MTISGISALTSTGGSAPAAAISTALQANVQASETASIEALFGPAGLGTTVDTTAKQRCG